MARWVNETSRVELHAHRACRPARATRRVRRSTPARRSSTRSCAQQLAVAHVERLVVDEQADDLAVGHVDDRLAGLRVAVAGLRVRAAAAARRTQFRYVPGQSRTARPRRGSPRRPMWPFESANTDSVWASTSRSSAVSRTAHGSTANAGCAITRRSSSSARSVTTMSAPCSRSASAWPTRSTPTTKPKWPARPAATPASASSNTAASPARRRACAPRRGTCPAPACRAGAPARRRPVDPQRRRDPRCRRPSRTSAAVGARRDHRAPQAGVARRAHEAHRTRVGLDTVGCGSCRRTSSFLRLPRPWIVLRPAVARRALGEVDAA